ncbi:transposon Tf2-6 polyprotein [Trichonephila clavipes]|nr:transposon Tf2-6 polyprotein [Trichonephila clavipes]
MASHAKSRLYVLVQSQPTIFLGLRITIHKDLNATSAELVFGENLRIPGDFLHDSKLASPSTFVLQLRNTFDDLRPVLSAHHTKQKPFFLRVLATCTHVFVRTDLVRTSLQPLYEGPNPVIKRYAKYFDTSIKEVFRSISTDRMKPCFFADPDKPTSVYKSSQPQALHHQLCQLLLITHNRALLSSLHSFK